MKFEKIAFAAILITLVSMTLVSALHTPVISMNPAQWASNADQDVSLSVSNEGVDEITRVELTVPETGQNIPLYLIKEISNPAGWTYQTTTKTGQSFPYKLIWTTAGAGIKTGASLQFGFKATSPSELGDYKWTVKTVDSKNSELVNTVLTSTSLAPLESFDITGEPQEIQAGKTFTITLKAYDKNGGIKTDYTGTVEFGSTDNMAILPGAYAFKKSDKGIKTFSIMLKTAGDKVILVSDSQAGVSKMSDVIKVKAGELVSLKIMPEGSTVQPGAKVEFKAVANDLYDNVVDVTDDASWSIDDLASGKWEQNVYTTEREGTWTVAAKYNNRILDGTTLTVQKGAAPVTTTVPVVTPETTTPEVKPTPTVELAVSGSDTLAVEAGKNKTMILTVENKGSTDLTKVKLSYIGVSTEWITVYPASENLKVGESKDFLIEVSVPENTSETKTLTFTATSDEGASATKEVTVYAGTAPTGIFFGLSKNLLQLGVVIIAVATVVIIAWELWFRK